MAVAYPQWKKVAWRYVRVFLAAFAAQFGVNLALFNDQDYLRAVIIAGAAAGIAAISKTLREGEPYSKNIHRLPL